MTTIDNFIWPTFFGPLTTVMPTYMALLGGYLLGSVPFGLILTKIAGLGDVRNIGSGNIGATNVLRTGNKILALVTLLLDGGKGAAAAIIACNIDPSLAYPAALAAFLGHLYPVWLRFGGGKGVATFLGIQLALFWPLGIAACIIWLLTAMAFRMSSLAALAAAAFTPVVALIIGMYPLAILSGILAFLIFIRHHANIRRILNGTESKIGKTTKD